MRAIYTEQHRLWVSTAIIQYLHAQLSRGDAKPWLTPCQ